jgi:GntR family transcriptional regulator
MSKNQSFGITEQSSADQILRRGTLPIYLQVAGVLRRNIETGKWRPGQNIQSLDRLAEEYGISRVTARQAITVLEEEGLIWRRQGKGTFVSKTPEDPRRLSLKTEWAALIQLIEGSTQQLLYISMDATPPLLDSPEGGLAPEYCHMRRLHSKDDEPYCVIDIYLDKEVFLRDQEGFKEHTVLTILDRMEDIEVAKAHQVMTISIVDIEMARLLKCSLGDPVANVRRVVTDSSNRIIYIGDIVYRGDSVKFDIDLI